MRDAGLRLCIWNGTRVSVAGVLLTLLGCNEPTCQSACEKSFQSCGMGQLYASTENPPTQEEQIQACANACSGSMLDDESAGTAAGWVSCVDAFTCTSDSDWSPLCVTCDAGYFKGASSGLTCGTARQLASMRSW